MGASQLHETASAQISDLTRLLSAQDEATLKLPCPGREKLGDGTIGATASHVADSYLRIAGFLRAVVCAEPDPMAGRLHGAHATSADRASLLERLAIASGALSLLAELDAAQLEVVPPAGQMKFCDGSWTLEQILTRLFRHQAHQIHAVRSAVSAGG